MASLALKYSEVERARIQQQLNAIKALAGSNVGSGSFVLNDGTATADGVFTLDDGAS